MEQGTINKEQKNSLFSVLCSLFIAALIVSNIYLQFPHSDRFVNFKGYLTSKDDIETVQTIQSTATKPYLVLANQSVGAAALDQFGFAQYVQVMEQGTENREQKNPKGSSSSSFVEAPENKKEKQNDSNDVTFEKQYFYSIPISSQAQEYFLRMTKEPSETLINTMFNTYEVNEFYLVLNDYWKITPTTKKQLTSLSFKTIQVDSNTIFQFSK